MLVPFSVYNVRLNDVLDQHVIEILDHIRHIYKYYLQHEF